MLEAVLLGAVAQSSLILSGLVVYGVNVPSKAFIPSVKSLVRWGV